MWPEVGIVAMCDGMEKTHAIPAETTGPLITWLQEPPAVLVSKIRAGLRQSVASSVSQAWRHVALGGSLSHHQRATALSVARRRPGRPCPRYPRTKPLG